ncbi:NAD(P)-dependent oxidoreductase [Nonomuraea longicatena]|uniref:NAD(P)-dependent oxidoreductase n=2 Tax=Nonomuraea longicatena TaxID=83682 RepID=A0ABP3ZMA7_9ACTN
MGEPMARRVLAAGHHLTVFNRTPARIEPLVAAGATPAASPAQAASQAEAVVTMLPYPKDVEHVLGEVLGEAAPGTVVIDCSTSSPGLARTLAERGRERGVAVLDAPVSGGPPGARSGTLSVMAGGDADALERARPVLEAFAATLVHHGPPGTGQLAKLVNQTLVAGVTLAACEAYALAEHGGLDLEKVHSSVRPGVAGSPLLDFLWARLASGDLAPGFKLDHFVKDLLLAGDAAAPLRLPGLDAVVAAAEAVRREHGGHHGTQALVRAVEHP